MTERQNLTDSGSVSQAYSAPDYQRLAFETSGLIQTSVVDGNLGDPTTNASKAIGDDW